jgi:hypothetical protein
LPVEQAAAVFLARLKQVAVAGVAVVQPPRREAHRQKVVAAAALLLTALFKLVGVLLARRVLVCMVVALRVLRLT